MSDPSYGCDPEMFVLGEPSPLTASTAKLDEHTIEVCWEHEGNQRASAELFYTLKWNAGQGEATQPLTTTPNKCYPVDVPISNPEE